VAARPNEAKEYFDESLVAAFQYSWRTLAIRIGANVPEHDDYRSLMRAALNGWLAVEFSNWGLIFTTVWMGSGTRPLLVKLFGAIEGTWHIPSSHWLLRDGTPRAYCLEELALVEREIAQVSESADDPVEEYSTLAVTHPNVGPQHPAEGRVLALLMPGFGFVQGKLEYIKSGHDEWLWQQRMLDCHHR
jgi:hypothetical protein